MTTCSRCGKVLHTGSIHTCSPQVVEDFPDARLPDVPAPSGWLTMTEDEFAAMSRRFAAATDYPTHRSGGLPQTVVDCADVADIVAELHAQCRAKEEAEKQSREVCGTAAALWNMAAADRDRFIRRAAALRQIAEEAIAEIENVERGWHEHAVGWDPEWPASYEPGGTLTALRARLAEIGGAS